MQLNDNLSILFQQLKAEISIVSIYINDFLLALNAISIFRLLKKYFAKNTI